MAIQVLLYGNQELSSYLGASPDGVLVDKSDPYSAAKLTVREACDQLDKFYLHIENGTFVLDCTHVHFYQVQGSMGLLGVKFYNFIVWTPQSFEVITINFQASVWETEMLPKLTSFYTTYMLPAMLY